MNKTERIKQGRKDAKRSLHPLFPNKAQIATQTATEGNKAFRLPVRTRQFHSGKRLKRTVILTEIEKGVHLSIKRLVPVSVTANLAVITPKPQYATQSLFVFS